MDGDATNKKESAKKMWIKYNRKGDNIIREGEVITSDKLQLLRDLGILTDESKFDFVLYIGIAAIVLIIECLIIAYIAVFNKDLLIKPERLLMIYIIFISTLLISGVMQGVSIYLIPVATSSMLISILLESRLALLANLCLTILTALLLEIILPYSYGISWGNSWCI